MAIPKAQLASLCKAHGLRSLAIFGSVLRDDFDSESDIDFLVEFEEGRVPGLLGIAAIEIEISKLLDGRKVDVRTIEDLSRYFRDEVLKDAEILYAQG
ncbi:MAG: nucleotidyltransferase [Chloroflexi bacterium]|nr:nucleotidyltransferase domain-containing protein [Chloroflexota bacterium]MXX65965.1 nucleotidyltransferase [Chloroflexota bacterium]